VHEQHWTWRRASHVVGNAAEHGAGQHGADVRAKHDQAHVMNERFLNDRGAEDRSARRLRPGFPRREVERDGIEIRARDGSLGKTLAGSTAPGGRTCRSSTSAPKARAYSSATGILTSAMPVSQGHQDVRGCVSTAISF